MRRAEKIRRRNERVEREGGMCVTDRWRRARLEDWSLRAGTAATDVDVFLEDVIK